MKVASVEVITLSVPIQRPVVTSFGRMDRRHAILVRVRTTDGGEGWGESWGNFPAWSPEERQATILQGLAPLVLGESPRQVAFLHAKMQTATRRLARQWGAQGPVSQGISALDIALWDLHAKAAGLPLYKLLGGNPEPVPVYASGLGPHEPQVLARAMADAGVTSFKLKVGFGREKDEENLKLMREAVGPTATLSVDANQAWDLPTALKMANLLERYDVDWLEEPLDADDFEGLRQLRRTTGLRIAAGENLYGVARFTELLRLGAVDLIQPDVTKVGGLTEAFRICGLAPAFGAAFAPHYLGAGVGLLASLQLFAAAPGGQVLEFDANPNPLRTGLCDLQVQNGRVALPTEAGIGFTPNWEFIEKHVLSTGVVSA